MFFVFQFTYIFYVIIFTYSGSTLEKKGKSRQYLEFEKILYEKWCMWHASGVGKRDLLCKGRRRCNVIAGAVIRAH